MRDFDIFCLAWLELRKSKDLDNSLFGKEGDLIRKLDAE